MSASLIRNWEELADEQTLNRVVTALEANGFKVIVVDSAQEARQKVIELVPEGAEVFTAQSVTLQETGIAQEINESGCYDPVRRKIATLNRETQLMEIRRLGAAPGYSAEHSRSDPPAMAKRPADRFASAGEFVARLA